MKRKGKDWLMLCHSVSFVRVCKIKQRLIRIDMRSFSKSTVYYLLLCSIVFLTCRIKRSHMLSWPRPNQIPYANRVWNVPCHLARASGSLKAELVSLNEKGVLNAPSTLLKLAYVILNERASTSALI